MAGQRPDRVVVESVDKSYYSLDDIVACSASINCSFGRRPPKGILGLVGQQVSDSASERDCKAEIPLFLANTVHHTRAGRVHLTYPFNPRVQEVLRADSRNVNLESLHQHFYRLGRHLTLLADDAQAQLLAETLLSTFMQRAGPIITRSLNCYAKATRMDSTEKRLYAIGMHTEAEMSDWFEGVEEGCRRKATSFKLSI